MEKFYLLLHENPEYVNDIACQQGFCLRHDFLDKDSIHEFTKPFARQGLGGKHVLFLGKPRRWVGANPLKRHITKLVQQFRHVFMLCFFGPDHGLIPEKNLLPWRSDRFAWAKDAEHLLQGQRETR